MHLSLEPVTKGEPCGHEHWEDTCDSHLGGASAELPLVLGQLPRRP